MPDSNYSASSLWQSRLGSVQNQSGGTPLPQVPCLIPIILLLDGCGSGSLKFLLHIKIIADYAVLTRLSAEFCKIYDVSNLLNIA